MGSWPVRASMHLPVVMGGSHRIRLFIIQTFRDAFRDRAYGASSGTRRATCLTRPASHTPLLTSVSFRDRFVTGRRSADGYRRSRVDVGPRDARLAEPADGGDPADHAARRPSATSSGDRRPGPPPAGRWRARSPTTARRRRAGPAPAAASPRTTANRPVIAPRPRRAARKPIAGHDRRRRAPGSSAATIAPACEETLDRAAPASRRRATARRPRRRASAPRAAGRVRASSPAAAGEQRQRDVERPDQPRRRRRRPGEHAGRPRRRCRRSAAAPSTRRRCGCGPGRRRPPAAAGPASSSACGGRARRSAARWRAAPTPARPGGRPAAGSVTRPNRSRLM